MRTLQTIVVMAILAGCSTTQVYHNPQGASGGVAVLYTTPARDYTSLGVISAKRYKPGWSDPTVSDAIPQLVDAARSMGADAVIVRQSEDQSVQDRFIRVEGEAIKYSDGSRPDQAPDPTACESCKTIGRNL